MADLVKVALAHCTRLATLSLNKNDIGVEGVKGLAAASWPQLTYLDLHYNQLKAEGAAALAAAKMPALRSLVLLGT